MKQALKGLRRYQEADRKARPAPQPVIATRIGAALRDYGGEGPAVLFVPSLINPPNILDLSSERSLLRWLAGRGRRVLMLDWGWPDPARQKLSVAGHVAQILLPLMSEFGEPVDLAGYCLGGTMAVAAAQSAPVRSLITIAAPWHFSAYPEAARGNLERLWRDCRPTVEALGVLPMEALQSAFWNLDPQRTIAKFEAFAELEGSAAETFVTLEDWANDGPPIGGAAAREMFEDFFAADRPGHGGWQVNGAAVDPARIEAPMLNIVSASDRIVPHDSAIKVGQRIDLAQGHVGMMVGSGARQALWEPLADWLSRTAAQC